MLGVAVLVDDGVPPGVDAGVDGGVDDGVFVGVFVGVGVNGISVVVGQLPSEQLYPTAFIL